MKRLCIIAAIFSLTFLVACGSNEDEENNANKEEKSTQTSSTADSNNNKDQQKVSTTENNDESQSEDSIDNQESIKKDSNSDLIHFKEYAYIKEKVSNIEDYKALTETDNPNKRIILYQSDEGQKKYKSIFIKKTNRLKLIELDKNGLLYNQVIK